VGAARHGKRQHEFASGRALLHELLGSDDPVLVGPSRAPRWPAGVHGSLAHDDQLAVAAVSREPCVRALGIDIEPATPLSRDLATAICRAEEHALDAHLVFTLKEAAYKAWSALGGRVLDHHDVVVAVDGTSFVACVESDLVRLRGEFRLPGGRVVALVVVTAEDGEWK
jgi:4'-phosphopantetheinyl transferase EntD